MTTNSNDQTRSETIDERVERLIKEDDEGTSEIFKGNKDDFIHAYRKLVFHS
jgi:hypothetical protein